MDNRRTFLKLGLSACAAGAISLPASARGIAAPPYYKVVFDERFDDARAFAAGAAERGIPTAAIRGDITNLFFDDLDLRWKQGPVVLAGYTTPASLFCLDLLARDRGMRVSHCVALQSHSSDDAAALVFWVIRPRHQSSWRGHAAPY